MEKRSCSVKTATEKPRASIAMFGELWAPPPRPGYGSSIKFLRFWFHALFFAAWFLGWFILEGTFLFHRKLPNHFRINISIVLRFGYTKTILGLTDLSMHLSACKHLGKLATRECFFSNGLQDVCAKTVQPTAISVTLEIYIYMYVSNITALSLSLFWYHIYMYIIIFETFVTCHVWKIHSIDECHPRYKHHQQHLRMKPSSLQASFTVILNLKNTHSRDMKMTANPKLTLWKPNKCPTSDGSCWTKGVATASPAQNS